jgi:hypothetical protein
MIQKDWIKMKVLNKNEKGQKILQDEMKKILFNDLAFIL